MGLTPPANGRFLVVVYCDLPVYQDVYRLILTLFEITRDFPRNTSTRWDRTPSATGSSALLCEDVF